jgi:RimJ/RimL family protein N-acetyltransferase
MMQPASNELPRPVLNIVGEKVALGPLRRDLTPYYQRWINDFEVTRTLATRLAPVTWEAEEIWYQNAVKGDHSVYFTIFERETLRPIGNTSLGGIDHCHRTAEFGILIGEKDCWGKGYGTETATLMLDYGFTALGLHNITLGVHSFNERGIRAYSRAGFRIIGRIREAVRLGGRAYDTILMDCLATEFQSPVLRKLLVPRESTD